MLFTMVSLKCRQLFTLLNSNLIFHVMLNPFSEGLERLALNKIYCDVERLSVTSSKSLRDRKGRGPPIFALISCK